MKRAELLKRKVPQREHNFSGLSVKWRRSVTSNSLWPHGLQPTRLLCPWDFPGKNTGISCHFLLQGIFLTQGLKPHLLHWQTGSLPLSYQGSPKALTELVNEVAHRERHAVQSIWIYFRRQNSLFPALLSSHPKPLDLGFTPLILSLYVYFS